MSSENYIIQDQNAVYFLTFPVVDWVDIFTRPIYKTIIVDSLNYCIENKGLTVHAWCLMTNHLHLIARAIEGYRLSDIIRDFKKFTAKKIIAAIKKNRKVERSGCCIAFHLQVNLIIGLQIINYGRTQVILSY
jgi:putative transposase